MVRNLIIQIFLGEEEEIEDHIKFILNRDRWKVYCGKMGIEYMFFHIRSIYRSLELVKRSVLLVRRSHIRMRGTRIVGISISKSKSIIFVMLLIVVIF